MLTGQPERHYLLSGSGGYGFIAKLGDMVGRVKAGKVVMTVDSGETVLLPIAVYASSLINPDCKIVLASSDHRLLAFSIGELKVMPKGARFAVDVADRRRIFGTCPRDHVCGIYRRNRRQARCGASGKIAHLRHRRQARQKREGFGRIRSSENLVRDFRINNKRRGNTLKT